MSLASRLRDEVLALYVGTRARAGVPVVMQGESRLTRRCDTADALANTNDLVSRHFADSLEHINVSSMRDALLLLGQRPATIIETGSSAWGTNSTALWDAYVETFGGSVWSVDIRLEPARTMRQVLSSRTRLAVDDSVRYLAHWARAHPGIQADLIYLDSWDVEASDPIPAAIHCVAEFHAIEAAIGPGTLILVDDTPGCPEWLTEGMRKDAIAYLERSGSLPGKGMLLDRYLQTHPAYRKVHHRYQVLYQHVAVAGRNAGS